MKDYHVAIIELSIFEWVIVSDVMDNTVVKQPLPW